MVKTLGYLTVATPFFKAFHEKIVENYLSTAKSVSRYEGCNFAGYSKLSD